MTPRGPRPRRCAFCHDDVGWRYVSCRNCGTAIHPACRAHLLRCPSLGCGGAPALTSRVLWRVCLVMAAVMLLVLLPAAVGWGVAARRARRWTASPHALATLARVRAWTRAANAGPSRKPEPYDPGVHPREGVLSFERARAAERLSDLLWHLHPHSATFLGWRTPCLDCEGPWEAWRDAWDARAYRDPFEGHNHWFMTGLPYPPLPEPRWPR